MTRRERHLFILASFGQGAHYHRDNVMHRLGWSAFTDEAIETITRETVKSYKRQQRYNREYRARLVKAVQP